MQSMQPLMRLTENEIMEAFQEAFPGHDLFQETIDFARAVERRLLDKLEQHCGDPECDECVPPGPRMTPIEKTFWLIERGPNQRQSPIVWWSSRPDAVSSYSWVESVHKATRFDSAEAAEAVAQKRYLTHYAITSHGFMDSPGDGATSIVGLSERSGLNDLRAFCRAPYGVEARPVTRQEDQFLRNAAKTSAKLVASGKLAPIDPYEECAQCGKFHYTHADEKHAFVRKPTDGVAPTDGGQR